MLRSVSNRENRIVPLYHQVEQVIRHRISTREYAPGAQIPSEHELGRELKVSRVTIREALRELVREHLLVKVQGKGTFVAPQLPKVLQPIKYSGFLEELYQRVQQLEVVSVAMTRTPPTDFVLGVLHLHVGLVHVNEPSSSRVDLMPFAGVKQSGLGREGPRYAMQEMTEERLVTFNLA